MSLLRWTYFGFITDSCSTSSCSAAASESVTWSFLPTPPPSVDAEASPHSDAVGSRQPYLRCPCTPQLWMGAEMQNCWVWAPFLFRELALVDCEVAASRLGAP